uniref:Putative mitogen-activated protein kinase n=1 Tax=Ixodes ricinus TaxID=34613 RepID=A0A0K8RI04_IXORI
MGRLDTISARMPAHRPDVDGLGVPLAVQHDLRRPVPPRRHILRQEARVVVLGVRHPRQAKVADLEVTSGVEEQVARLEIPVQNIGRMNVFEAPQDLVEEVADVVVAQLLRLEQLVQVSLHQALHNVDIFHLVDCGCPDDVSDVYNIFVLKPCEDLDLPQCPLAVGLVLEWGNLLDGLLFPWSHCRRPTRPCRMHLLRCKLNSCTAVQPRTVGP